MPRKHEGVFGRTPTDLISLALKQLAISSEKPRSVYLIDDPLLRDAFFFEMKKAFGKDFPELETMNFVSDSFLWSQDVSDIFSVLLGDAYAFVQGEPYMHILLRPDTREYVERELDRVLGRETRLRERFLEFTAHFEALVFPPPWRT